jgi:N-acetylmuramoyl-L-alanine amidase
VKQSKTGTKSKKTTSKPQGSPNENVKRIQQRLCDLGFNPGPVDGYMGQRTRDAIKSFQTAKGLKVDGIAGKETLGALMGASGGLNLDPVEREDTKTPSRIIRPCHTLVWHCTATPEGREFTREQIRAMHLARGFSDIGYHKLVHLDGKVSEGRSEEIAGSHVSGHNTGTLGYSYIGGVTSTGKAKDTRTPAQKVTMERLTIAAIKKYRLKLVTGHRDLSPDKDHDGVVEPFEWLKICPCFDTTVEYGHLLARK